MMIGNFRVRGKSDLYGKVYTELTFEESIELDGQLGDEEDMKSRRIAYSRTRKRKYT